MRYVILDIETTGLEMEHSAIIEVAALIVSDNKIEKEFSSFVQYDGVLSDFTKHLTGITDEMLKGAPSLGEVVVALRDFIGDLPVIAHNGYNFDFRMLERDGLKIKDKYDSMEFVLTPILRTTLSGD